MKVDADCATCGAHFDYEKTGRGRQRKYCSPKCWRVPVDPSWGSGVGTCAECGVEFKRPTGNGRNKKFCSQECRGQNKAAWMAAYLQQKREETAVKRRKEAFKRFDRKAARIKNIADSTRRECAYCGVVFVPLAMTGKKYYSANKKQVMCGKACSTKAAADAAREKIARVMAGEESWSDAKAAFFQRKRRRDALAREITALKRIAARGGSYRPPVGCAICEKIFRPKRINQTCCSSECTLERKRRRYWEASRKGRVSECPNCHVQFSPLRRPGFVGNWSACSDQCQEEYRRKAERRQKRIAKAKRRSRKAGARRETVDPFDVFKRDKWKCRACGVDTPRELRGTYEPNAPELDHVVPLARGGWHAHDNCQTLCRQCNISKGAMMPSEWKSQVPITIALF